jgi:organic radical activating enzyme
MKSIDLFTIFVSLRCNNKCKHCLYGCNPYSGEDMPLGIFMKAIEIAKTNKIAKINLFGGEPFMNRNILKMIEMCIDNNFPVIIATNGYWLSKSANYDSFRKLTQKVVNKILFSIGNDEYHRVFYDPNEVISRLKNDNYSVTAPECNDEMLIITEHNKDIIDIGMAKNNKTTCCADGLLNQIGVLPNGSWTICPPSLIEYGNIDNINLALR